jgi:predicted acylesterase/phospholipase RssA
VAKGGVVMKVIMGLIIILGTVTIEAFYNSFLTFHKHLQNFPVLSEHPYQNHVAHVVRYLATGPLMPEEQAVVDARLPRTQTALAEFLGKSLDPQKPLKIALCLSGGGYRAMILSLGYLVGLDALGLFDAALYIATLSGSTWLLAPWIIKGESLIAYKKHLLRRAYFRQLDHTRLSNMGTLADKEVGAQLWRHYMTGQPYCSANIYGALLANTLLAFTGNPQEHYLSFQQKIVETGALPFPIYTTVAVHTHNHKKQYQWYEFNPYYVCNIAEQLAIPLWAFGRRFDDGKSHDYTREKTVGYLLGMFGSAYAGTLQEIAGHLRATLHRAIAEADTFAAQIKFQALRILLTVSSKVPLLNTLRFLPVRVYNPWHGLPKDMYVTHNSPLAHKQYLTLLDGGLDFNIPIAPLLQPNRDLDVVIIGDASKSNDALKRMLAYARTVGGITYVYDSAVSSVSMHLYRPTGMRGPILIYFPFIKDQDNSFEMLRRNTHLSGLAKQVQLDHFNPYHCLVHGYCSTFHFDYTPREVEQLAGYGEFVIRAHEQELRQAIESIVR